MREGFEIVPVRLLPQVLMGLIPGDTCPFALYPVTSCDILLFTYEDAVIAKVVIAKAVLVLWWGRLFCLFGSGLDRSETESLLLRY